MRARRSFFPRTSWAKWKLCAIASAFCTRASSGWKAASAIWSNNINVILKTSSSKSWVTSRNPDANNIFAIAGVVIKEMYRRKDFYVLFALIVLITLMLGSLNFFDDDRIVRYLKDASLLLIWLFSLVIAITTTARQIPAERESRTIFPLLAKPVGRGEFVVGKFLGCWLACGIALLAFYFFFGLLSASREHIFPF